MADKKQSEKCPSMAAEAAIHELLSVKAYAEVKEGFSRNNVPYKQQKGNKAIEVPPLHYNPQEQTGWVYIVANKPNGILYVGQTTNLPERIQQHKDGKIEGFTKKYGCKTLVYFEGYQRITESIERETAMKSWKRSWKIRRILETNPSWRDLHAEICQISL